MLRSDPNEGMHRGAWVVVLFVVVICFALMAATKARSEPERGLASFYWHGQMTANCHRAKCERFDPRAMTCAHKTRPFGQIVTVRWRDKSVRCRINDRGPYINGRVIDLSKAVAELLGIIDHGVVPVTIED